MIKQSQLIIDSYKKLTGEDLIVCGGDSEEAAKMLFEADFVLMSQDTSTEPLANYANRKALELWEISWDEMLKMPTKETAEPMHRDERAKFLKEVQSKGYVKDYTCIRISSTGKRFKIIGATVFNLIDEVGDYKGLAAYIKDWDFLR